ncbi:E3 ubiquitin-protein ligase ORTHRUS 2 [Camellia lanceoleosa]|uniref:E3 ubiquitin-protein ligase ORTHRUS 2 n=1 Tax=Camellia lanceoleosa TaxID=1840588 RepID=A0ACC0H5D6_9ERIC|nr:E3 ubiquitin-protein ligase ORTHRUS 2 [Camellia lanceoleosa]
MAHSSNLPCNGDGICMICKKKSAEDETIIYKTYVTPWHVTCLFTPPQTLADTVQRSSTGERILCDYIFSASSRISESCFAEIAKGADTVQWKCLDCSVIADPNLIDKPVAGFESSGDLIAAIRAIESDQSLTVQEKAKQKQQLISGGPKNFSNFSRFILTDFN